MKKNLFEQSNQYFEQQKLTALQLENLQRQLDGKSSANNHWAKYCVVAGIILLLAFTAFINQPANMVQKISQEVVYNHIKKMPLEVHAANFSELSQYFSKLDFSPVPSAFFAQNNYSMLGARYCSIQGVVAMQLQYQGKSETVTLYQTAYDKRVYGDIPDIDQQHTPHVSFVRGYRVEIWREGGVLMACVAKA